MYYSLFRKQGVSSIISNAVFLLKELVEEKIEQSKTKNYVNYPQCPFLLFSFL